jgi:sialate O-acetylesterase
MVLNVNAPIFRFESATYAAIDFTVSPSPRVSSFMKPRLQTRLVIAIGGVLGMLTQNVHAQPMPREDVVGVPAIAAGLCVSNVFQTNMVLQRDKPIHIWGWAEPGEQITVAFAGRQASTRAGEDRAWKVTLPAVAACSNPQQIAIKGKSKALALDNILVGDVWVLGGQSNMEFELEKVENGMLEAVSANFPQIRILTVPVCDRPDRKPRSFPRLHEWSDWFGRHFRKGDWDVCTPEIARELSAIGYTFARRVHLASQVPIGVIDASRGGTTAEAWTPLANLRQLEEPHVREKLADWDLRLAAWDAQQDLQRRIDEHRRWVEKQQAAGKPVPEPIASSRRTTCVPAPDRRSTTTRAIAMRA